MYSLNTERGTKNHSLNRINRRVVFEHLEIRRLRSAYKDLDVIKNFDIDLLFSQFTDTLAIIQINLKLNIFPGSQYSYLIAI